MNRRVVNAWNVFTARCNIPESAYNTIEELDERYTASGRYYHSWDHVIHCISLFHAHEDLTEDPAAVETALWFHDVVYTPGSNENEKDSADRAAQFAAAAGFSHERSKAVKSHILATAFHFDDTVATGDTNVVLDIDISVFGSDTQSYDMYERAIRLEYAGIPEEQFTLGRIHLLEAFLAKTRIYRTDRFHSLYEKTARINLRRAIRILQIR